LCGHGEPRRFFGFAFLKILMPPGAKTISVNNVMRVLVTLLQNKRGMSSFPESGRSDEAKIIKIKVRFRPEAEVK